MSIHFKVIKPTQVAQDLGLVRTSRGSLTDTLHDIGLVGEYGSGGVTTYAGLVRSSSSKVFQLFDGLTANPFTSDLVSLIGAGYNASTLALGTLNAATSLITGVVTIAKAGSIVSSGALSISAGTGTSIIQGSSVIAGVTVASNNVVVPATGAFYVGTAASPTLTLSGNAVASSGDLTLTAVGQVLISAGSSTSTNSIATKSYVDSVASGLNVKKSVRAYTTGNIISTNTVAGTGSTHTITAAANSLIPAASFDGVTLVAGDRVLVSYDTATAGVGDASSGIYTVTSIGSNGTLWQLTRASDANTSALLPTGSFTFVSEGATFGDTGWVMRTTGTINMDTIVSPATAATAMEWTQFSSAGIVKSQSTGTGTPIFTGQSGLVMSYRSLSAVINTGSNTATPFEINIATDTNTLALNFDQTRITGTGALASGSIAYTTTAGTISTIGAVSTGVLTVGTPAANAATTHNGTITVTGSSTLAAITGTALTINTGTSALATITGTQLTITSGSTSVAALTASALITGQAGLTVSTGSTSVVALTASGLITGQSGLTVSTGLSSVVALTASGLITGQAGLTVSTGSTSVVALTASGLITGQAGLTVSTGLSSVVALTASGVATLSSVRMLTSASSTMQMGATADFGTTPTAYALSVAMPASNTIAPLGILIGGGTTPSLALQLTSAGAFSTLKNTLDDATGGAVFAGLVKANLGLTVTGAASVSGLTTLGTVSIPTLPSTGSTIQIGATSDFGTSTPTSPSTYIMGIAMPSTNTVAPLGIAITISSVVYRALQVTAVGAVSTRYNVLDDSTGAARFNGMLTGQNGLTITGASSSVIAITATGLITGQAGLTITGATSSVAALTASGLITGQLGLTVSSGLSSVVALTASGLITGQAGLTVSTGLSSVVALTASGLITGQAGLTVSTGSTSVVALTASGLITGQSGLTVSSGLSSVVALTASGLITGQAGLTVSTGSTSVVALTASGLITGQSGLTVSTGSTSVVALTASGLITGQNGLTVSTGSTSVAALSASGIATLPSINVTSVLTINSTNAGILFTPTAITTNLIAYNAASDLSIGTTTGTGVTFSSAAVTLNQPLVIVKGGVQYSVTTLTASATVDNTYVVYKLNATSGNMTITLPALSGTSASGRSYRFVRVDATSNTVTIATTTSDKIDGVVNDTVSLQAQFDHVEIMSCTDSWLLF